MKKLLFTLLTLLASASYAALPQVVRFATEATYPPFEYMDASGQIKGFDIDLAKALCAKMEVQCTFSNQPWDSLIPSLKLGKFDALIGAMAITDARKQQVDFTNPYLDTTAIFIAPKTAHFDISPEGLANKTIGVQGGTTFEQYLNAEYGNHITIKSYAGIQDALLDLSSGRVDAVLGDTPSLLEWLHKHDATKGFTQVGELVVSPQFFGRGYGIAVQKGNAELAAAFNRALQQITQDGTYERISALYFGP